MTKQTLRWGSSQQAQSQADAAFVAWRDKAGLRKAAKIAAKANPARRKKRPAYVRENGTIDYRNYICSAAWQRVRDAFLRRHGWKCNVCGTATGVQVHHRSYRTIGRESDKDLEALCGGCHANVHEGERGIVMDPMTAAYLKRLSR